MLCVYMLRRGAGNMGENTADADAEAAKRRQEAADAQALRLSRLEELRLAQEVASQQDKS
jgi:hypothetical protein